MTPKVRWATGAYLTLGELWFCLAKGHAEPSKDYSHIAFNIQAIEFQEFATQLLKKGVEVWQKNVSEGQSLYIFDPDGHKLEIHAGTLETRMQQLRVKAYPDLIWF